MDGKKTRYFFHILEDLLELKEAGKILRNGGLVVFPTETVYGLGVNTLDEKAVRSVFEAKGRPADNPLIVHIDSIDKLPLVSDRVPEQAMKLFEKFSPGPLTIVLPKNKNIPDIVTAGLDTVAVRFPAHPIALELIKAAGVPIAAPSANRSGRPSPTSFEMALAEMDGRADAVINGGNCQIGLESTVISINGDLIHILRPGAITEEMLLSVTEGKIITSGVHKETGKPISPGMKYTHYKPKAEVYLIQDIGKKEIFTGIEEKFNGRKIGFILVSPIPIPENYPQWTVQYFTDLAMYANRLYQCFVELDSFGAEVIIAETVEEKGIGKAIMNRLLKASGGKII